MKKIIIRWIVATLGLWLASELLGESSVSFGGKFSAVAAAGLLLAVINTFIRPVIVFLTLPAVLLTLGIFMIVINALTVSLAAWISGPLEIDGFGAAVITGMIIGVVNWLVSALFDDDKK